MKKLLNVVVLFVMLTVTGFALAANAPKNLGSCMVDSLNGKERKQLAKWIFFAIAAHPDIKSYSSATSNDINQSDKTVGELITRLLTSDCPNELKAAYRADPSAVTKAFELVGQVAMQELMTNQNVTNAITNYAQYADLDKVNSLLSEK